MCNLSNDILISHLYGTLNKHKLIWFINVLLFLFLFFLHKTGHSHFMSLTLKSIHPLPLKLPSTNLHFLPYYGALRVCTKNKCLDTETKWKHHRSVQIYKLKKGERTLNILLPKSVFFRPKELSYNVMLKNIWIIF